MFHEDSWMFRFRIVHKQIILREHFSGNAHVLNCDYNEDCISEGDRMVSEGRGRLFRRKDGKCLIYVPKDLAEDSMFPFRDSSSVHVKITFKIGRDKLTVEQWTEEEQSSLHMNT